MSQHPPRPGKPSRQLAGEHRCLARDRPWCEAELWGPVGSAVSPAQAGHCSVGCRGSLCPHHYFPLLHPSHAAFRTLWCLWMAPWKRNPGADLYVLPHSSCWPADKREKNPKQLRCCSAGQRWAHLESPWPCTKLRGGNNGANKRLDLLLERITPQSLALKGFCE